MASNNVELVSIFGDDLMVAQAAWASTDLPADKRTPERVKDLLLNRLKTTDEQGEEIHESPFRHPQVQFLVTADVATHIHLIKHKIGVEVNSESARYKELKDKYYLPDDWSFSVMQDMLRAHNERAFQLYHEALATFTPKLGRKRAKETARYFLTYATQLNCMVTMSFQACMNFIHRRHRSGAQNEVSTIAEDMLRLVWKSGKFPYSLEVWGWSPDVLEKKFSMNV